MPSYPPVTEGTQVQNAQTGQMAPAVAAGAIAAASAAGQIYATGRMNKKQREWSEKMAGIQRQQAIDDWNATNQYNSPAAQMQRFKDAKLNPNLIYGQQSNGASVRSTDVKPWNPETPNVSGVVESALGTYQDYTLQSEQIKNMQAQRANMELDMQLKTIQVMGNEMKTSLTAIDLQKARETYDTSIQTVNEQLRALQIGTDIKVSTEVRNAALHAPNLMAALEKVALLGADKDLKKQQLDNLQKTGVLQDMEIAMRKLGLSYSDGVILRMLAQFAGGKSLPELVKNLYNQLTKLGGPMKDTIGTTGAKTN